MSHIIQIANLYKSFGKTKVLQGIDLNFEASKISVVLGPNGSGKTTLIKSILGMVIPESGSIKVMGTEIQNQWAYRENISYLPQIANFPANLTVQELVNMITDLRGKAAHEESDLINDFGLGPFMKIRLTNLSGGTKQKVNILLAFMYDSPIMMLDEPTNGLDPQGIAEIRELIIEIANGGKTIIIASHLLDEVQKVCSHFCVLQRGKLIYNGLVEDVGKGAVSLEVKE